MSVGGPLDYSFRYNNANHPALVAYFDMSTLTPGGLMKNLAKTGAPYDGTISGALVLAPPLIRAKRTKCMDFDGATNDISLSNPIQNLTGFSIVCWANMDALGGMFFSAAGIGTTYFYVDAAGAIRLEVAGVGTQPLNKQIQVISKNFMFVVTKDVLNVARFYVDGKYLWSGTTGASSPTATSLIGLWGLGGLRYNGRLDNFMFWNIALTQEQVWSLQKSANPR